MESWIRSALIHYPKTFCTGLAFTLMTFFSWSSPTTVDSKTAPLTARATAAAVENKRISPARWIEIDLSEQRLRAYEGKKLVYSFRTSTGKRSTPTPRGSFRIDSKYRTHRMRGSGYDISDVPYTMYFYNGYAIHGAYWHNRFGTPVSHGCVNLPVKQARKLYNWTSVGTEVVVRR